MPQEKSISLSFIKSMFNGCDCNDMGRELFELPIRSDGVGIVNPSKTSNHKYQNSKNLMEQGTELIKKQQLIYDIKQPKIIIIKNITK